MAVNCFYITRVSPVQGWGIPRGDVYDMGVVSDVRLDVGVAVLGMGVVYDVTLGCGRGWLSTAGCSKPYLEENYANKVVKTSYGI